MHVYIAIVGERYEGYSIIGVHSSYESAEAKVLEKIDKSEATWGESYTKEENNPVWWSKEEIDYFEILEWEVKD